MSGEATMNLETNERQLKYVEEQEKKEDGLGLVFADAFIRGMRDIGYKSPGWALSELTDNSIQAQAETVEILFGNYSQVRGGKQPQALAIMDDGVGMIPKMISYAVRWGGTDREGDRNGFGRYGYGLPSSCVSIAKRYTVYSKTVDGEWNSVAVDIDELAAIAGNLDAINDKLSPSPATPPDWVVASATKIDVESIESGTIVVLDELDRLRDQKGWKNAKSLKTRLIEHFGIIYRHWIPNPKILIDGTTVEPLDPLFLLESGRFFDETNVMAKRVEAKSFTVVTSSGNEGKVTIRASYLPPNFQLSEPGQYGVNGAANNNRFKIMKEYNGLHITRDGREIDCISPRGMTWQNYQRNVKIEINFDPQLDEFFGITTSKQQIVLADDMWDRLWDRGNLRELIGDINTRFKNDGKVLKASLEKKRDKKERSSERAMKESKPKDTHPKQASDKQKQQGKANLERAAEERAQRENRAKEDVIKKMEEEAQRRPFRVDFQSIPEGPFYRTERLGLQKILIINTDHPFYEKVYSLTPDASAGLEVLLFVMAESELDGSDDARSFYIAERQHWSNRLRIALDSLTSNDSITDASAAAAALQEDTLPAAT